MFGFIDVKTEPLIIMGTIIIDINVNNSLIDVNNNILIDVKTRRTIMIRIYSGRPESGAGDGWWNPHDIQDISERNMKEETPCHVLNSTR